MIQFILKKNFYLKNELGRTELGLILKKKDPKYKIRILSKLTRKGKDLINKEIHDVQQKSI